MQESSTHGPGQMRPRSKSCVLSLLSACLQLAPNYPNRTCTSTRKVCSSWLFRLWPLDGSSSRASHLHFCLPPPPSELYSGLLKALFSRFDLVTSLVIAACLTPTDPAICAAIIGKNLQLDAKLGIHARKKGGKFAKKHVPHTIRHLIIAGEYL